MFALFTGFIDQPWLAAAPALGFLGLWMLTRLRSALTAAVLWGLYGAWEYAIWAGHACSGDCNIRVDLLLIVPATANIIAKFANGVADDFLSSTYLASTAPVLIAPAMNTTMWEQPATQRNIEQLKADGVRFVERRGIHADARTFRQQRANFALVVSEFGLTEGIVTLDDLMYSLVGDMMPLADDTGDALAVRRPDGSWLLDGLLPIDEMKDRLEIRHVPQESLGNYHTVGGFVLASLGRIPRKAERFSWADWEFEVVDVDRNRVDQVLATRVAATEASGGND